MEGNVMEGNIMEGNIRVTTGKLREKEEILSEMVNQAGRKLQSAEDEMEHIGDCFQAEAVLQLKKAFGKFAAEGYGRLQELKAHIEKLQEIAAVYEEAEKTNELVTADY